MDPLSFDIVVVGSLNADLSAEVDRFPEAGETLHGKSFQVRCGGKGANQAYAARLLGVRTSMIGRVGEDAYGEDQCRQLGRIGVDVGGVGRDAERSTGVAIIGVESNGENRIILIPGANGAFTPQHVSAFRDRIQQARYVLLQLEIPYETTAEALMLARKAGVNILLDPAPARTLPEALLRDVDILTPNLGELAALTGAHLTSTSTFEALASAARSLCRRGVQTVIVKLGERGALRVDASEVEHVPAARVRAVDTTAAGDCFNGALAARLTQGDALSAAMRYAVDAATLSVTRSGAQDSMPSVQEVISFQSECSRL